MNELKQTIRYTKAPDGRAIAWSTMGSGPAVLVVSGMGHLEADLRTQLFLRPWSDLASRYTLIRYDGRGYGLSDREFQEIALDGLIEDALTKSKRRQTGITPRRMPGSCSHCKSGRRR